jgi:hypothetical protein
MHNSLLPAPILKHINTVPAPSRIIQCSPRTLPTHNPTAITHVKHDQNKIINIKNIINPLNAKSNPTCHLLVLLRTHHILHVSRIRVKLRTLFSKLLSLLSHCLSCLFPSLCTFPFITNLPSLSPVLLFYFFPFLFTFFLFKILRRRSCTASSVDSATGPTRHTAILFRALASPTAGLPTLPLHVYQNTAAARVPKQRRCTCAKTLQLHVCQNTAAARVPKHCRRTCTKTLPPHVYQNTAAARVPK